MRHSCRILAVLVFALIVFNHLSSVTSQNGITGITEGTYMAYVITETARNGTQIRAIDSYYILTVYRNGSFDAEIKWGVVGYPTDSVYVSGLVPINPSDPELRTVPVVVDLRVRDGTYRFIGSINHVQRKGIAYNGLGFEVISSNETVFDPSIPNLVYYRAVYYYDQVTGILLRSSYQYGPPGFETSTVDLVATNALPLTATVSAIHGSSSPSAGTGVLVLLSVAAAMFPVVGFLGRRNARKRSKLSSERKRG
jgi:hypothetical protein